MLNILHKYQGRRQDFGSGGHQTKFPEASPKFHFGKGDIQQNFTQQKLKKIFGKFI